MLPVRCSIPAECSKRTGENPASSRDAREEDEAGASHAVRSQAEPVNEEKKLARVSWSSCYLILPTVNEKRSPAKRHWLMWLSLLVSRESATGPSETVNGYRWRSKTAANAVG